MAILNYPRHFILRGGGSAVLALGLTVQPPWSPVHDRLFVLFGLSGALHAVAVVLALEKSASTVDGFHNPKPVRYRRGRSSPEGFYRDSYDYATLKTVLLDPLGPGGTGRFRRAAFDVHTDALVDAPEEQASPGSILPFDGIFLHRPQLRRYWDYSVFLRVEWARNHRVRNRPEPGHHRYQEGQNIYFRECEPWTCASIVIDNDDLATPVSVSSEHSLRPGR